MNYRKKGTENEEKAVDYLRKKGYRILEMNYRTRFGEIDIIAVKGKVLVIVEVKYRSSIRCGEPAEAVDFSKQRKICRVALDYIRRNPYFYEKSCRFDIIGIYGDGRILHLEDAFSFHV